MNRLSAILALLALILVALVIGEQRISQHRQAVRLRAGQVRPFVRIPLERVRALQIESKGRKWLYVRRDSLWRYPAHFDALVLPDRMERLLESLLHSYGTVVSTEPGDLARFGLGPDQALRVQLGDASGRLLADVRIGRGAPAPGSGESYAQRAGEDTIFHLHSNPRRILDQNDPPLLDPHVLPRALGRGPIVRVSFARKAEPVQVQELRRVETALSSSPSPGRMFRGPTYEWIAAIDGREEKCVTSSGFAYTSFLSRLRHQGLRDPRGFEPDGNRLILEDAKGNLDTLETGGRDEQGNLLLRLCTTGQVMALTPEKADLLFPRETVLLDSLPDPSPYQAAEPGDATPF